MAPPAGFVEKRTSPRIGLLLTEANSPPMETKSPDPVIDKPA